MEIGYKKARVLVSTLEPGGHEVKYAHFFSHDLDDPADIPLMKPRRRTAKLSPG